MDDIKYEDDVGMSSVPKELSIKSLERRCGYKVSTEKGPEELRGAERILS